MAPDFNELARTIEIRIGNRLDEELTYDTAITLECAHDLLVSELTRMFTLGMLEAHQKASQPDY